MNSNKKPFFTHEMLSAVISTITALLGLVWVIFGQSNDSGIFDYHAKDYIE